MSRTNPFVILRAVTSAPRSECLNIGIVAWSDQGNPHVLLDRSPSRLRALHPNLARIDLEGWSKRLKEELARIEGVENQIALLPHMIQPFRVDEVPGCVVSDQAGFLSEVQSIFEKLVVSLPATIKLPQKKKQSKLHIELRSWFRSAKLYSSRVEDLSRRRVVSNYPVDPSTDLYVDFALKNGKIHVVETLDLRGLTHVTSAVRGDAAIKSITLAEAKNMKEVGKRIALVHASDHSIAQPAVRLIDRYADEVWHMDSSDDRQSFARFVSDALHVDQLKL